MPLSLLPFALVVDFGVHLHPLVFELSFVGDRDSIEQTFPIPHKFVELITNKMRLHWLLFGRQSSRILLFDTLGGAQTQALEIAHR